MTVGRVGLIGKGLRGRPRGTSLFAYLDLLGDDLIDVWDTAWTSRFTLSGVGVTAFTSLNGLTVSQAVISQRPIYRPAGSGPHGVGDFLYDGLDDFLNGETTGLLPTGAVGVEGLVLGTQDALPADTSTRIAFTYGGPGSAFYRSSGRRSVVSGVNRASAVVGNGTTGIASALAPGDFSGRCIVSSICTGADITAALNGGESGATAAVPATDALRTRHGATTNGTPSSHHKGGQEIILLHRPLTAPKRAALITCLQQTRL